MSNPLLTGQFVIRNYLKDFLVTARDGGNHSVDALVSNVADAAIGPNETFTFFPRSATQATIRTSKGFFVSARGGGGIGGTNDDTLTFQTERRQLADDVLFRLDGPAPDGTMTIATLDGHFVTAVGGGGKSTRAFHTDATTASTWEKFYIVRVGDLGSGLQYAIRPAGTGINLPGLGIAISFLTALGGGNRLVHAMTANSHLQPESKFRLHRQPDGSFALQTSNGFFVTADNGGGLAHGTPQMDNLITTKTHIQDWEKFKIVETSPGRYTIQTISGFFIGVKIDFTNISTRISFPDEASSIDYNAHFELIMTGL